MENTAFHVVDQKVSHSEWQKLPKIAIYSQKIAGSGKKEGEKNNWGMRVHSFSHDWRSRIYFAHPYYPNTYKNPVYAINDPSKKIFQNT